MHESIYIENLLKAQAQFEAFRFDMIDDRDKAGAIQVAVQAHIDEDFEESDLPYNVDEIDLNQCSTIFRQHIEPNLVLIQTGPVQCNDDTP